MTAYYNEIDPYAADWLENLIRAGHIAPGVVDRRSIVDVRPRELADFTQCHFFAGIGVWSLALRRAGWRDDQPVWTGSCPCQPFSAAGNGGGFDDERHLWPAWQYLIDQRRPPVIFGEQVASKDALVWWDLVQADLEASRYAAGASDLCAASVGGPHIRQRLWWVGIATGSGQQGIGNQPEHREPLSADSILGLLANSSSSSTGLEGRDARQVGRQRPAAQRGGEAGALADDDGAGFGEQRRGGLLDGERPALGHDADGRGADGGLEHPNGERRGRRLDGPQESGWDLRELVGRSASKTSHWSAADWIPCRDGKWRPVEPGTFPLAHGVANRVGRLRAYGNAIVAPLAEEWIRTVMECMP